MPVEWTRIGGMYAESDDSGGFGAVHGPRTLRPERGSRRTPDCGTADAAEPRLRVGDFRRRQPKRHRRGELSRGRRHGVERRAAAAPLWWRAGVSRGRTPGLHRPRWLRRQRAEPQAGHRVRVPLHHEGPGWRRGTGVSNRSRANPHRAGGSQGRAYPARLPARLEGRETTAGVYRPAGRLLRSGTG